MEKQERKNNDDVSTGELARMIAAGFSAADKKFDAVEGRLGNLEERFGNQEERFDGLEKRFDTMDARLGRIEADLGGLREEIVYRHEFEDVRGRVKYIERKLGIESGV